MHVQQTASTVSDGENVVMAPNREILLLRMDKNRCFCKSRPQVVDQEIQFLRACSILVRFLDQLTQLQQF